MGSERTKTNNALLPSYKGCDVGIVGEQTRELEYSMFRVLLLVTVGHDGNSRALFQNLMDTKGEVIDCLSLEVLLRNKLRV